MLIMPPPPPRLPLPSAPTTFSTYLGGASLCMYVCIRMAVAMFARRNLNGSFSWVALLRDQRAKMEMRKPQAVRS